MAKKLEKDTKFILYQVLYIIIISIMVYKGAELNLQKVTESDNPEIVPAVELSRTKEIIKALEERLKNTTDKKEAEALKRIIKKLENEKAELEKKVTYIVQTTSKPSDIPANDQNGNVFIKNPNDTLFSGPPIFNSQPLYMNTDNLIHNRSKAVLKLVDADNRLDEIVPEIMPSDPVEFQLGKRRTRQLAVVWKDRDSVIFKLDLLPKPDPTISFNPSVSQSERKINANTNSTVSLLRVKSVRPKDIDVKFKIEPSAFKDYLNIKREYRSDEVVYQVTFNFKNRKQVEDFIDKYEDDFYDSNKNNYFFRINVSVFDLITGNKFDNLDQTFKVFFYRYE